MWEIHKAGKYLKHPPNIKQELKFLLSLFHNFVRGFGAIESYPPDLFPERGIEGGGGGNDLREAGGGREFAAESGSGPHIGDAV